MSTSPVQSAICSSLDGVLGNLITEYALPSDTEVRHYYIDVGSDFNLSFVIGLHIKHSQGTYQRFTPTVADTEAPGSYEADTYPYITLNQEYFTRRNHMSYEGDNDETQLMGKLCCVEKHRVMSSDYKWTVLYARTLYKLDIALVQPWTGDDDQHATIQIETVPGASPKFRLLTSSEHDENHIPPDFTVVEVQPETSVVGKPMVPPIRKSQ